MRQQKPREIPALRVFVCDDLTPKKYFTKVCTEADIPHIAPPFPEYKGTIRECTEEWKNRYKKSLNARFGDRA